MCSLVVAGGLLHTKEENKTAAVVDNSLSLSDCCKRQADR